MVIVLVIGPKVRVFKPGRGRWIFNGDKNPYYDFLRGEIKALVPCRKILWNFKEPYEYERDTSPAKLTDISYQVYSCFATRRVYWYLPENSGG
jgi:hypothetical protein